MRKYSLIVFISFISFSVKGQIKNHSWEIRTGLQGQFYFKNRYLQGGIYLKQYGGTGRAATIGAGIPINFICEFKRLSVSISPVVRYAKISNINLFNPVSSTFDPNDVKWGITPDLHLSVQWKLKSGNWLWRKVSLGLGVSIFNVGLPFNTYYNWSYNPNFSPAFDHQASTLTYWGLHALYERKLSDRLTFKFMIMYSDGDWVDYVPILTQSLLGNISLQYRIWSKKTDQ